MTGPEDPLNKRLLLIILIIDDDIENSRQESAHARTLFLQLHCCSANAAGR